MSLSYTGSSPVHTGGAVHYSTCAGPRFFVNVRKVVQRERHLLDVVGALHTPSGFTGGLNGWQEQGNQNADNGDNDEKFD
jgi:hypothetical protein